MWMCPYVECICPWLLVGGLDLMWMPVMSFFSVSASIPLVGDMNHEGGARAYARCEEHFLSAQWLSVPWPSWDLLSCQSGSLEGWAWADSVPFKCDFLLSILGPLIQRRVALKQGGSCAYRSPVLCLRRCVQPMNASFWGCDCPSSSVAL